MSSLETTRPAHTFFRTLRLAGLLLLLVLAIGTVGYYLLGSGRSSVLDCLYMTFITVTTIGYGEVVDLSRHPAGRVFTMVIALAGIGTLTYLLSSFTAFIVEGTLSETFRRRAMEKRAAALSGHYIVCGAGQVGSHIVMELRSTGRPVIVLDLKADALQHLASLLPDLIHFEGDATDNDQLIAAGLPRAAGVFAATGQDNQNLVIALTSKHVNPRAMVVARCGEVKNAPKLKAAGADAVISPSFIGGLRMASEMVRPAAVSFLDVMLRETDKNLRIEEVSLDGSGMTIGQLGLEQFDNTLLLAVREPAGWVYHPKPHHVISAGSRLVVMTTPQDRIALEKRFGTGA